MGTSDFRHEQMQFCKECVSKEFGNELSIARTIIERYCEFLKEAGKVQSQTKSQIAIYALAVRSYRALHCALDTLENGYYEVAMTILRSVYENMLQMMYFSSRAADAEKWLYEGKDFSQKEIRNSLGKDGKVYKMMSEDYAHSLLIRSMVPLTSERSAGTQWRVDPYPSYSPYDCEFCLFCWIDFAGGTLKQLLNDFRMNVTMSGRISPVIDAANDCIRTMSWNLQRTHEKRQIDGHLKNIFDATTK